MKEYFSHDYYSRNDPKLIKLQRKLGCEGVGIYWCLVEMFYEQEGSIREDGLEDIAFALRSSCERIKSVLQDFELFILVDGDYYSESINRRLSLRQEKSNKARISANLGWEKRKNQAIDANAKQTHSEGNAIKVK